MPEEESDYDNRDGEDFLGPPLPPDDRLWRHPSELFQAPAANRASGGARSLALGSARQPTRAGALSAGLAGAMLATGLVLIGTHLAVALNRPSSATEATTSTFASTTSIGDVTPHIVTAGIGADLQAMVARVGDATVVVTAIGKNTRRRGSGLVIGSDCIIVTSYALVAGAAQVELTLPDGSEAPANVLGVDPATGIAVLRCPAKDLATIKSSGHVKLARHDLVALFANKASGEKDLDFGRVAVVEKRVDVDGAALLDEIETSLGDADQGSALLDGYGDVIGVVVGDSDGADVATPTWLAMAAASQIVAWGKVETGVLGITGRTTTESVDVSTGGTGVQVTSVEPGSAASVAGIKAGDVIESVDGGSTGSMVSLEAKLHCLKPGTPVKITLMRGHEAMQTEAVLRSQAA